MNEGKICKSCLTFKSFDFYGKEKTCINGYRPKCKECMKDVRKKHYEKNKEKYKQAYQEFITRNPDYLQDYYKYKKEPKTCN